MLQRFIQILIVCTLTLSAGISSFAGDAIELRSTDTENTDDFPIGLIALEIDIEQIAGTYQITLEAEILNGHEDEETEVEFLLPMPKGAIINDYALDIQGVLIDGVLTEKERARKTYTDKVTRTIDPGIAERAADNRYKTRIFPVLPGKTRTIRLGFVVEADEGFDWQVKTGIRADNVRLSGNALPNSLADNPAYRRIDGGYEAANHRVDQSFKLSPDAPADAVIATHSLGGNFLIAQLSSDEIAALGSAEASPRKVAIIWDTSLSRSEDKHSAERGVLKDWLKSISPDDVRVIMGSDRITFDKSFRNSDAVKSLFDDVDYDGGSDLNSLLDFKGRYDICVLVSDGHMTIGRGEMKRPDCPVYALTSSADPNIPFLSSLASMSGGQVITDLSSRKAATAQLSKAPSYGVIDSNVSMPVMLGSKIFAQIPIGTREAKINLLSPSGARVTIKRDLGRLDRVSHNGPGTIWASYKTEALRAEGATAQEVIAFSRPFSIAGPESTLIVLETAFDYINADIPVPDNYPKELHAQYEEALADHIEERDFHSEKRKSVMLTMWNKQVEWWNKDYKYDPKAKPSDTETRPLPAVTRQITGWDGSVVMDGESAPAQPVPAPPPPPALMHTMPDGSSGYTSRENLEDIVVTAQRRGERVEDLDEVVVTGVPNRRNGVESRDISIEIRKWTADRPYLNALKEAASDELEQVYRKQKSRYGDLPAFYLEVADFYQSLESESRAAEIALGALELPAANTETITQVAHRLLAYGQYERAIELYRYSLELAPNLPQSYLNLAVALHDLGLKSSQSDAQAHYFEALSLLEHIVITPWNFENDRVYDGVEIVAMTEANGIIPRLSSSSRAEMTFPAELIQNLDLDSRVVMDWNIDHADMDLAVIEPTGEKASYQNKLTGIGGQLSDDMTDGYGPEQYVLRNAYAGAYDVQTTFFSASEYNPNGAVSVRVRMTQNFGRNNQSTETVIVELKEQKAKISVGEFVVE